MKSARFTTWLTVSILIVLVIWSLFYYLLPTVPTSISVKGQQGDSFGSINALFSGLAFAVIVVSFFIQRIDLQASLDEMKEANKHSKVASEIQLLNGKIQANDLHFRISQSKLELKAQQVYQSTVDSEYSQHTAELALLLIDIGRLQNKLDDNNT